MAERRPDVFLIILDCARSDHLSCYGYQRTTSPHVDDFCHRSTIFEQAFTVSPWTPPSHASMFTGCYPPTHGVQHGHLTLDCEAKTLAELLRDAGYQTVGLCANPHLSEARQFTRGFEEYFEMWRTKGIVHRLTDKLRWAKQRLKQRADCIFPAHRTLARLTDALQWHCDHGTRAGMINRQLRSWFRSQRDEERPCFVFINYTEAHLPYTMVPPFYRLSLGTPSDIRRAMDLNQDPRLHLATGAGMKDGDFDLLCRTSGRQGRERGDACRRS